MRRRCELTPAVVDRDFSFQVVVRCIEGKNIGHLNESRPVFIFVLAPPSSQRREAHI